MINIYHIYLMSGWFLLASANVQYQRKIKLFSSIQFSSIVVVVVAIVVVVVEVVVEAAVVVMCSGCGSSSKISTWTNKRKLGAIAGVRVGKYNLGTRAGKCKVLVRVGKYKLADKYKFGARTGSRGPGPGPEAKQRARGREIQRPI